MCGRMGNMLYLCFALILLVFMGILVGGESYRPVQNRQLAPVRETRPRTQPSERKPPLAQKRPSKVTAPITFRPLRMAWSVVAFIACYLLSAYWAMTFLPGRAQTTEMELPLYEPFACAIISVSVLGIMP